MNMENILTQARNLIQPERKREWYEELEEDMCSICPALTWQQRLIGCATCIIIGLCLSLGSLFR